MEGNEGSADRFCSPPPQDDCVISFIPPIVLFAFFNFGLLLLHFSSQYGGFPWLLPRRPSPLSSNGSQVCGLS